MEDCHMNNEFARRLLHQQMKVKMLAAAARDKAENIENKVENSLFAPKKLCFDNEQSFGTAGTRPYSADRYIPLRSPGDMETKFSLLEPKTKQKKTSRTSGEGGVTDSREKTVVYNSLLRNELVGDVQDENSFSSLFTYTPPSHSQSSTRMNIEAVSPYSLSPVSTKSQLLLRCPRKQTKRISRVPFKVLDAPELQDDFYLNLVDWSSQNVLSVGLASCVYLWSASTSQVTRLCDLSPDNNSVTSVASNERGNLVAVGTHHGHIEIWDAGALKQVDKLTGHSARVGTLAWNGDVLSSGSRDRSILQRDLRVSQTEFERRLSAHRQEVCGLKWSPDNQCLASGGNDNKLHIWNMHSLNPVSTYDEHMAAVKAIAWSPHHHGILATGGGTADKSLRFWNTLTGQAIQAIDTGSQVCNLAWSKHTSELVSTHGYSQNQILLWKYPSLTQVSKLTGHSCRVLYLAVSPCGESIVTGAGDETLRFWNVFSKAHSSPRQPISRLSLFQNIR